MVDSKCPYCGYKANISYTLVGVKKDPGKGDINICYECGGFSTFDENIELQKVDVNSLSFANQESIAAIKQEARRQGIIYKRERE